MLAVSACRITTKYNRHRKDRKVKKAVSASNINTKYNPFVSTPRPTALYLPVITPSNTTREMLHLSMKAISASNITIKDNTYRAISCIVIYYQFKSDKNPLVKAVQPARKISYCVTTLIPAILDLYSILVFNPKYVQLRSTKLSPSAF